MAAINAGSNALLQKFFIMGAHAIIIPLVIFSGIEVSGAHFNPMVTACFVAIKKLVSLCAGCPGKDANSNLRFVFDPY